MRKNVRASPGQRFARFLESDLPRRDARLNKELQRESWAKIITLKSSQMRSGEARHNNGSQTMVLMKKYFLVLALLVSSSAMAKDLKADAEVNSFLPLDQQSSEVFSEISKNTWSLKYNVEGALKTNDGDEIVIKKFPFNYEKFLTFSVQETERKVKKKGYSFGMIGGTWVGVDARFASGGGGYAMPIPVKKMGYKKIDENTTQFMFWAREDYYVDLEARRMHTDILNPLLANASDTIALDALLQKDPTCQKLLKANRYANAIENCTVTETVFDYLVLEYSSKAPALLKVTGRNLNELADGFSFEMKIKTENP